VEDRLEAWMDGRVQGSEAEDVARHLESCFRCSAELARLMGQDEKLRAALRDDPNPAYFDSLEKKVMSRLVVDRARDSRSHTRNRALVRLAGLAAVIAAVSMAAVLGMREGGGVDWLRATLAKQKASRAQAPAEPAQEQTFRESVDQDGDAAPPASPGKDGGERKEGREVWSSRSGSADAKKVPTVGSTAAPAGPAAPGLAARSGRAVEMTVPTRPGEESVRKTAPTELERQRSAASAPAKSSAAPPVFATKPQAAQPLAADDRTKQRDEAANVRSNEKAQDQVSGARTDANKATAAREPSSLEAAAANVQVCGKVSDPQGRPMAGAQVVATAFGRISRTDAAGGFCLELPPGRHELRAMSVGYNTAVTTFDVGYGGMRDADLTLAPVPALGEGMRLPAAGQAVPPAAADSPASTLGPYTRSTGRKVAAPPPPVPAAKTLSGMVAAGIRSEPPPSVMAAQAAELKAIELGTALAWETAAFSWNRAFELLQGGPFDATARAGLAECRYRAWKIMPTPTRARAASEALTSFLVRAPHGPARDRAAAWAEDLK
jgi:hypothetical protein